MKISNYAVKNYQFTLIMFLMVAVLGVTTIMNMPRSEDPDMHAPQYPIIVVYPGTSPKDMEELVVDKIEKRIYGLEKIKRIKTNISDGVAVLDVEYKYGSNVDDKYQEIVREVNALRGELPKEIVKLEVLKVDPSNVNILQMSLVSENATKDQMRITAKRLQEALEKVTTLKNVTIHGLPKPIVRVDLQLEKMAQMNIAADRVMQAIQSEIANIPGGSIIENNKSFNIKTSGNFESAAEVANTVVFSYQGRNVLLKDVAHVYHDYEADKHVTRLNGYRSVFVTAAQKSGENIAATQKAYQPIIANFKQTLPKNIDLIVHFDQADNVSARLQGLGTDFIIAILLVAITLLPLGFRAATVVMISI
ncbi:MAG TPA: multidrug transporter AcrB, partial [Chitinophagaceae bacterium]|nr:multidrug transporter AcrB [Chitinophagaceae bacterium]